MRNAYVLEYKDERPRRAIPAWHREARAAIRELRAVDLFRETAILPGRFDDVMEQRLAFVGPVVQEEHDQVRAQLDAAFGGFAQRLAANFLAGHYPWLRAIAKWAEERKFAVHYPSAGVDFSFLRRGGSVPYLEQILFVVVATEGARRSAWLARQNPGASVGARPDGSRGVAVLHMTEVSVQPDSGVRDIDTGVMEDGPLLGLPSAFGGWALDLSTLETRLAELAPICRADELVAFVPVPDWVFVQRPELPPCLRLVSVSYEPEDLDSMLAALADVLGVAVEA